MEVGGRLAIVPYWERHLRKLSRINIVLDPGPSFGAGDHPSTIMALEFLDMALTKSIELNQTPSVLDVGTGTGVLAIAAKSLGAGLTVAFDIDLVSVFSIAKRNVQLNSVNWEPETMAAVHLFAGDLNTVAHPFDIVTANLAAPLLLRLRDGLAKITRKYLVISGIADEMFEQVLDSYTRPPLSLVSRRRNGAWHALLLMKNHLPDRPKCASDFVDDGSA